MRRLLVALALLAGCSPGKHPEPPPPPAQPAEPDVSLPPGHEWPSSLQGSRCGVVIAGHHESLGQAEELAFAVSFAEHLFADGSPFVRDDGDGTPPPRAAAPRLVFRAAPYYAEARPHLDMKVDAEVVVELNVVPPGGPGYTTERVVTVAHGLIGSLAKKTEQRLELARAMGRLGARRLLRDLATQPAASGD